MSFNSFTCIPSFKTNKQQINKKMPDIKMLEPCSDIRYRRVPDQLMRYSKEIGIDCKNSTSEILFVYLYV